MHQETEFMDAVGLPKDLSSKSQSRIICCFGLRDVRDHFKTSMTSWDIHVLFYLSEP